MEIQKATNLGSVSELRLKTELGERILFIDNIRWLMIVFVVLIHLNCTYGNIGMWYYQEARNIDLFSFTIFGMIGSFTQAYFMGLLFFIAGYFVPGSYDKKGIGRFLRDRFYRLAIPTIFFMLLLHPLTILLMEVFNHNIPMNPFSWYMGYLTSFHFISGSGPLWFALALLIFSVIYALLRWVYRKIKTKHNKARPIIITHTRVIVLITFIALSTFLIRLAQPIGTAFFNMQLSYFAGYVILFILGVNAYRWKLLTVLPSGFGQFWFGLALRLGWPLWGAIMLLGGVFKSFTPFTGGFYWQAAAYAFWESFFCIGVCLGLIVLFRDKYNSQGRIAGFLSENAFGVYVFHTPLMVGITMLFRGLIIYPLLKMILMAIITLPICYGFSYLLRKNPLLKKLFS